MNHNRNSRPVVFKVWSMVPRLFQGGCNVHAIFMIVQKHHWLFHCVNTGTDSAKQGLGKTTAALAGIKVETLDCPGSHCLVRPPPSTFISFFGIGRLPGQGSNPSYSLNLDYSYDNAGSLTHGITVGTCVLDCQNTHRRKKKTSSFI